MKELRETQPALYELVGDKLAKDKDSLLQKLGQLDVNSKKD